MADEADLANDLMSVELKYALDKLRQHAKPLKEGAKECLECGDNIPDARRALGFSFCVACAEESERRKSQYADG